uniref:Uncharacterized protein n=1 Tax=Arundo donax TaxID=35708 RepID=A0A0A9C193_ARUDO
MTTIIHLNYFPARRLEAADSISQYTDIASYKTPYLLPLSLSSLHWGQRKRTQHTNLHALIPS